jgi:hypothetical protein
MRRMAQTDRRIATIATGQLGAFSRTQAHDAGLSDRQLRSRVQSGFLVQNGPNAFRIAGTPTSLRGELKERLLDIGDPVWCCAQTAAALHGFDGFALRRPFHLLLPRERSLARWNTRIHRSQRIDLIDTAEVDGMPVTSPVRTLLDLARVLPSDQLAACVDSALRDGGTNEDLLHRRIEALRSQGRFGLPLLHEVLAGHEVTRGGQSWLEREYLRLISRAGVPRPDTQPVLSRAGDRLVRVDCRFPGTNVVVELLGYRFHRSRGQMATDATRYNALLAKGYSPYQFTYGQIVSEADYVVTTTKIALSGLAA